MQAGFTLKASREIIMEDNFFIDKQSGRIIKFFKAFNIGLLIANAITVIAFCFIVGSQASIPVEPNKTEDIPALFESSDYDDEGASNNKNDSQKFVVIILILLLGTGYSLLIFMGIEMAVKHFSNVSISKGLQFEMFKQTEEYGYYIKHLEDEKNK